MTRIALLLCTAGYTGYFPFVPGTVGSIVGLAAYAAVSRLMPPRLDLVLVAALFAVGVWATDEGARHFGVDDPAPIVFDEVVGMLVTLALLRVGWAGALAGFLLFRLLDVVKPYPAGRFERLPGGLGIMADDAVAGMYANLALRLLLWLASGWLA